VYKYTDGLNYKGDTSTHAQGTDPKVALGAYGELPGIYLDRTGYTGYAYTFNRICVCMQAYVELAN